MKKSDKGREKRKRSNAGFTLVEIMIVVTILGLLASIVAIQVPGILHKNKVKIAKRNIEAFQSAIDMYYIEVGEFPKTLDDLVSGKDEDGNPLKLIKKVSKDPWRNDFVYVCPGQQGEDYNISSYGADKQAGGEQKNKDINSWDMDQPTDQ